MTYRQILVKIHDLHEARKAMSLHSIYHQQYQDQCIELNDELRSQTGRNYTEFSRTEIDNAILDVGLGLQES